MGSFMMEALYLLLDTFRLYKYNGYVNGYGVLNTTTMFLVTTLCYAHSLNSASYCSSMVYCEQIVLQWITTMWTGVLYFAFLKTTTEWWKVYFEILFIKAYGVVFYDRYSEMKIKIILNKNIYYLIKIIDKKLISITISINILKI